MANYPAVDYLLDRANIHDVITKMSYYVDTRQWDKLADEVFIPTDLIIDYSKCFGVEPTQTTAREIATNWKQLMDKVDAAQHIPSAILITLPQPGTETVEPRTAFATCNGAVTLVKKDADGGPLVSNGGRYDLELKRVSSRDSGAGNPWRITKLVANLAWVEGNMKLLPYGELREEQKTK
ncbi:uncharacterized protein BDCG_01568 [Blastomyces dermatitidis ER-3]|nr:uncharacterized protein BDCG_01568 [Blastomyces dermatitidis ER-3]EEQ86448.2 hypothetical protein BDCG_01568 [Blastomyces dermatitidis ER-3]EQL29264.1 hypothetical protein BDFG_08073 [Blastomyces dermatitidis ATCC 26199]